MKVGEVLSREARFERATVDQKARTVELAFASETPVERYFGHEILECSEQAVDRSRLEAGVLHLLMDHDRRDLVGVVESIRLAGGVARAVVRFSRSGRGEEVFADVRDGIRQAVSVGYQVLEMKLESSDAAAGDTFRVTRWQPLEISLVAIPADPTVGIGRSFEGVNMPDPIRPGAPAAEPAVARERERVADLEQLASRFKAQGKLAEVIRDGWSVQRFQRWIIDDHLESGRPLGTARTDVGMGHRDLEDYSLRRAILARLSNDWRDAGLEREASDEIARRLDREPRGFFVPLDVLHRPLRRDLGKVAPTTAGATLVGTQHLAASFIDVLRARSVLFRLGAQPLTGLVGDVEIPRQSAAGGAAWIAAEGGDAGSVEGDFDAVTLTPHTIANRQTMTRRLLKQSSPEVEEIIRRDLAFELALAIDRAGISGTGAAGEPVGILSTSGIAAVVFGNPDGGAPTWALILQAESLVAADNADMGNLWYLTTPEARGKMKAVEKVNTTGEFLWNDRVTDDGRRVGEVNGYPAMASTQVPASLTKGAGTGLSAIIFGNFGDVLIGEWGILDLLPDPYEKARSGGLVLHAFQDVDVAIRHPESFAAGTDLNPA